MDEDMEMLFGKRDVRKKKEKDKVQKRSHKQTNGKNDSDKESFKKMREELDELRKREAERTRELDELKKKIDDQEKHKRSRDVEPEYEFHFNKEEYLNKGFIDSAKWIKDNLSKRVTEKMLESQNKSRFEAILIAKRSSAYLGVRTCARFNRDEPCNYGKWHTTHKPELTGLWTRHGQLHQQEEDLTSDGRRNEIRLHACTLCFEVLGAAYGHSVIKCPWILKKNWKA